MVWIAQVVEKYGGKQDNNTESLLAVRRSRDGVQAPRLGQVVSAVVWWFPLGGFAFHSMATKGEDCQRSTRGTRQEEIDGGIKRLRGEIKGNRHLSSIFRRNQESQSILGQRMDFAEMMGLDLMSRWNYRRSAWPNGGWPSRCWFPRIIGRGLWWVIMRLATQ